MCKQSFFSLLKNWTTTAMSLVAVLALMAGFASNALAAGETGTVVWSSGANPGINIRGTAYGATSDEWAGTIYLDITGGSRANTFCTDVNHNIGGGDQVTASDQVMDCRMRWLLLHYPPRRDATEYQNDTAPGRLADVKQEMAARQATVWYFSDGFVITSTQTTPMIVYTRTLDIIAAVNAQSNPCEADAPNVAITPNNTTNAAGATTSFTVKLTQGDQPVANRLVNLETGLGTLSSPTVTTDANGEATFDLTSAVAGTSRITATAQMLLPVGTIFLGVNTNKQKIVLGQQTSGPVSSNALAAWVTGGTIAVHAFDDLNMNGTPQDGELGQSGWTVAVQGQGNKTTDANGNVTWSLPAGTYTVTLTQKSGWHAVTPINQTITLASDSIVTINFGQIKLPVVKVQVFQDNDLSASLTGGDAGLAGWSVALFRQDGSQAAGWNAASDGQGWVYFSNDPVRNPPDLMVGTYYAQETLESGWYATTGISKSFTLVSGDVHGESLGNIQAAANLALVVIAGDTPNGGTRLIHANDPVAYHYQVTNAGNTFLSNVQITDNQYGAICDVAGLMAPGATQTCDKTANPASSVTNVGTVSGNPVLASGADMGLADVAASDDAVAQVLSPVIHLTANGPAQAHMGDLVAYNLTIQNTGNADLSGLTYSGEATLSGCPTTLAAGATANCAATRTTPQDADPFDTSFGVTGQDALGALVSNSAGVSTDILHPAMTLSANGPAQAHEGDVIVYPIHLANTGDAALSSLVFSGATFESCPTTLATGATADCTASSVASGSDPFAVTLGVSGLDALGALVSSSAGVSADILHPAIDLNATGPTLAHTGDALTYNVTVHNTGDADLSNLVYTGAEFSGCPTTLAAGATATCSASATATHGDPFVVTLGVAGQDGLGGPATDSASISTDILTPSIHVSASSPVSVPVGATIIFVISVQNTNDTALNSVVLTDSRTGFNWTGSLAVGESRSFTATYTTQPSDVGTVVNTVTASGQDALGKSVSDASSASTLVIVPDADGDGVPDTNEGSGDADGDGIPNYLDTDSDGDGISDAGEYSAGPSDPLAGCTANQPICFNNDADGDGIPNFLDADSDGDGILDRIEGTGDADGDGIPNYLDTDSDGDGIPDAGEYSTGPSDPLAGCTANNPICFNNDADGDGVPNFLDADSDGDGILDRIEGTSDPDGDGIPNYLDTDSDGDGILDRIEGTSDPDGDGVPNYLDLDSDGDGISDAGEYSVGPSDPLAGCTANDPVCFNNDVDGDGLPNYLDGDSDGDGLTDSMEGTRDSDGDGIPDYLDNNPNNNVDPFKFKVYLPVISR